MTESHDPTPDAWAAVFARMAGVLLSEQTVTTVLELITSLAKDTLPDTDGSGITLVDDENNRSTSAATGQMVERLDALQYELGDGPCLAAIRDGVPVRVDDLDEDERWVEWSRRAAELGMSSSLSVPLQYAGEMMGALKVYSTRPRVYTADSEDILGRFAEQAAILLANMHTLTGAEALNERLLRALRDRDLIATAKGIVMLRENIDADRAVQRLLELSTQRRIAVREVAAEIVASTYNETVWGRNAYLPDGEHRHRFLAALRAAGLGVEELWLRYFALGGEVGKVEIEAYLNGLLPLPRLQHDLIAHAINERLDEIAPPRAPYSAELPPSLPEGNGVHGKEDPEGYDSGDPDSRGPGADRSPGAIDEANADAAGNDVDEETGSSPDPGPDSDT